MFNCLCVVADAHHSSLLPISSADIPLPPGQAPLAQPSNIQQQTIPIPAVINTKPPTVPTNVSSVVKPFISLTPQPQSAITNKLSIPIPLATSFNPQSTTRNEPSLPKPSTSKFESSTSNLFTFQKPQPSFMKSQAAKPHAFAVGKPVPEPQFSSSTSKTIKMTAAVIVKPPILTKKPEIPSPKPVPPPFLAKPTIKPSALDSLKSTLFGIKAKSYVNSPKVSPQPSTSTAAPDVQAHNTTQSQNVVPQIAFSSSDPQAKVSFSKQVFN